MVFRTFFGLLVSMLVFGLAEARPVSINPSHPDQYTVVEGDTLWDISGRFLNNPTQWPELWSWNRQIRNPHLIYPGDTVYFSVVDGQPQLSFSPPSGSQYSDDYTVKSGNCVLSEEDIHSGKTSFALAQGEKLEPCIRETTLKKAISLIPSENIAKFLTSPRVVGVNELASAPYVIDYAGEHLVATMGDKLYVRSIPQPDSRTFTIYREGEAFKSPETGEILGFEAKYIAESSLVQEGDPATIVINKAKYEVLKGDRLMPKEDEQFILNYFPRPPEQSIKGSILYVLDGVNEIGKYNVVVIDKGTVDGLLPGHELDILKRGRITSDPYSSIRNDEVKLPDELIGKLMVFRPFERVSYALVMKASQGIHLLDKVQTP